MHFGEPPVAYLDFLKQFCRLVPTETGTDMSSASWTRAVKKVLHDLMPRKGMRFFASYKSEKEKHHEWLVDVAWYQSDRKNLAFVAESEWASWFKKKPRKIDLIRDDFEKLMSMKAPLKLMIFESDDLDQQKAIIGALERYLGESDQNVPGERYLLVDFNNGSHWSFQLEIPSAAKDASSIKFLPVPEASNRDVTRAA